MKKLILVLVMVLYIASIAVVNFFGLEVGVFDGITYVTSIQCDQVILRRGGGGGTTLTPVDYDNNKPVFAFEFAPPEDGGEYTYDDESIATNPNAIELDYVVFPYNADETTVRFEYDEVAVNGIAYFSEGIRTLVFLKPDAGVTLTIVSTDGSNVRTSIYIYAYSL